MKEKIIVKKHFLCAMYAAMAACLLLSAMPATAKENTEKEPLQIVTTIFPVYDWITNILGDNPGNARVTMLMDNGVDLHRFQPTADDMMTISACDLFIYVGGESDRWVNDALHEAVNEDMVVLNLLDELGDAAREEELVEGMQPSDEAKEEDEGTGYDEHIWLSLKNAALLSESIARAVGMLDEAHAADYEENKNAYVQKLEELDQAYEDMVSKAQITTVLFGDRFPFRYLTEDYGLTYYAAFDGCSAETEASFETIMFLAQKMDELSLHTCLVTEGSDQRIAETIVRSTKTGDQQILAMNSMQAVTSSQIGDGVTYLSVMEGNLQVLEQALR